VPAIQHPANDIGVPSKYRIRAVNTSKEKGSPWDHDLVIENSVRDGRNVVLFLIGEVYDLE